MGSNFAYEARNTPSSSCQSMVQEIHVLLVDHDNESLTNTTKMLEMCSYRVTVMEMASAAISVLLSGKTKFDIVLADVNSPDFEAFKLLYHAVNMDLPVILMSEADDTYLATMALANGAFLFIKKPATMEILQCLWQHVYREKERIKENERSQKITVNKGSGRSGVGDTRPSHAPGGKGKAKEKSKGQKGDEEWYHRVDRNLVIDDNGNSSGVKRKVCTEWTQDLHAKFVDAVMKLGEGRCFPKDILELMETPGLTRMQVASHLQKFRNNNQQTPDERMSHFFSCRRFCDLNRSPYKPRKFGSMPQLGRVHRSPQLGRVSRIQPANGIQNNYGSVGYVPSTMTNASNTNQAYNVRFEPGPSNTSRGNIHSANYFFILQDPACPMRNFSSEPQGSRAPVQNSNPCQNSAEASRDSSKGHWSSVTSKVESDGSETKANIKSE